MKMILLAVFVALFSVCHAQTDSATWGKQVKGDLKSAGKTVGKGAKKVGNKTAELASKGASKVIDKTYDEMTGPDGQTIYINKHSRYYWVDKKGHRHFVKKSALKAKM